MPLPPTTKSIFAGGGSGSTKSPCGDSSRTIVPGASPLTRCSDRKPSGIAFTVIATVPSERTGADDNE